MSCDILLCWGELSSWELENQDFWPDYSRNLFSFPILEVERVSNFLTLLLCRKPISFAVCENEKGSACY